MIDFLTDALDAVGETKATILSAYRTAETNTMLVRTNFGVAERSQHVVGRALDIRLESRLSDAMTRARAMQRGGVGWYPHSGFIHIDTGPIRNWTLDGRGLDTLLIFDGSRSRLDGTSQALLGGPWRPLTWHRGSDFSTSSPGLSFLPAPAVFASTRNGAPASTATPAVAKPISSCPIPVDFDARRSSVAFGGIP